MMMTSKAVWPSHALFDVLAFFCWVSCLARVAPSKAQTIILTSSTHAEGGDVHGAVIKTHEAGRK